MLASFHNDPDNLRIVALGLLGFVAIMMFLVIRLVQKTVWRIVLLLVLVGLAGAIWIQRDNLSECSRQCECQFFGMEVDVPTVGNCGRPLG